jgi:hypothetical protein
MEYYSKINFITLITIRATRLDFKLKVSYFLLIVLYYFSNKMEVKMY